MSEADEIKKLASHFKTLGVDDPEGYARSEIREGIPQYAKLIFLKEAWKSVVTETDDKWIENIIRNCERRPNDPCGGAGIVLKRMLAAGITKQEITDLVRVMQYETLFGICNQIDDPSSASYPSDSLPEVNWVLTRSDEEDNPIAIMDGLHEDVLMLDPTGREMRPRV